MPDSRCKAERFFLGWKESRQMLVVCLFVVLIGFNGCAQLIALPVQLVVMLVSLPFQIIKYTVALIPLAVKYAPYAFLFVEKEHNVEEISFSCGGVIAVSALPDDTRCYVLKLNNDKINVSNVLLDIVSNNKGCVLFSERNDLNAAELYECVRKMRESGCEVGVSNLMPFLDQSLLISDSKKATV